jgi:hypothetical protein
MVFVMTTMYAVLFAAMRIGGAGNTLFAVVTAMVTGVGFAQAVLFGGKYPRAASVWAGAVLLPLVMIVARWLGGWKVYDGPGARTWIGTFIALVPLGMLAGYVAGLFTAGVFYVIDAVDRRMHGSTGETDAAGEHDRIVERTFSNDDRRRHADRSTPRG